jgi:hypothetical protein
LNVLVMHQRFKILIGMLLAGVAPVLQAAEPLDKSSPRDEIGVRHEDRDARPKDGRKTNGAPSRAELEKRREQFKNMTPEERAAKRKEIKGRLEKRIAELRAKRASATLTPQESRELERREQILKRFEAEAAGGLRPKTVLTNSPAQN